MKKIPSIKVFRTKAEGQKAIRTHTISIHTQTLPWEILFHIYTLKRKSNQTFWMTSFSNLTRRAPWKGWKIQCEVTGEASMNTWGNQTRKFYSVWGNSPSSLLHILTAHYGEFSQDDLLAFSSWSALPKIKGEWRKDEVCLVLNPGYN